MTDENIAIGTTLMGRMGYGARAGAGGTMGREPLHTGPAASRARLDPNRDRIRSRPHVRGGAA
jgi:hypothetical protein